ncbi:hypothetical protein HMPREF9141_0014 [Prevotella multiformis DSM 16608]|uniref:Uncharacterized protein n=2 Tax=Prevotella multiformis TaxID=282402 RepID=F0F348_9BACT|nr:hypothetical protein HMPREF9141_0014 [Prevotella multiformis DSM 16608]
MQNARLQSLEKPFWRLSSWQMENYFREEKCFSSWKEMFFFMERIRSRQINSQMGKRERQGSPTHTASSEGIDFKTPLTYTHNI